MHGQQNIKKKLASTLCVPSAERSVVKAGGVTML